MYASKDIAEPTCEGWWWRQAEGKRVAAVRVREGDWVMVWADVATNTWRQCQVEGITWIGPIPVPSSDTEYITSPADIGGCGVEAMEANLKNRRQGQQESPP